MKMIWSCNKKVFLKSIGILMALYILTIWSYSYHIPASAKGIDFENWGRLWLRCFPVLFAVLACAFYTMKLRIGYGVSGMLLCLVLGINMKSNSSPGQLMYGVLLLLIVLALPIVAHIFSQKRHLKEGYLFFAVLVNVIGDFLLQYPYEAGMYAYSECCYVLRIAVIFSVLAVTIGTSWSDSKHYTEEVFVSIVFFYAISFLFILGRLALRLLSAADRYKASGYIMVIVELGVIFFLLLNFLLDYVTSGMIQVCYLFGTYLLVVGKELLFYLGRSWFDISRFRYYKELTFDTAVILVFATYYVFQVKKRKKEVTFRNSILGILLFLAVMYVVYIGKYIVWLRQYG